MTTRTSTPAQTLTPELIAQREAFYAELPQYSMGALWSVLGTLLPREPAVKSVPYCWRWRDVRPRVLRSGELVTAAEAERRVLMLLNPGLPPEMAAITGTLYAGVQLLLPGETARTHHHSPSAIRFVIEGEAGFTSVEGEKSVMQKGDFLTTPLWSWHDHGNEGNGPVMWLDGLDLPLITKLDAVFFDDYREVTGQEIQPVARERDDSIWRWGSNLRPTWQRPAPTHSPVVNYRWATSRRALHELRDDAGSRTDGICLEYVNPQTGGPVLPTMSAYLQLLRKGEHTLAHRHVASTVYHVAEGGGYSVIAGERFDWEEGDTFVVPAWTWHEHASEQGEAVLFSFSDRPVLAGLGLEREEIHPASYQS